MYTVLIADDEKMIKKSISALIQNNPTGFQIVGEAKDGEEASQLNQQFEPHLIITDIRMPKMNGLAFIQKVNAENPKAKFIIISGYDKFEYAQSALRFGVVDFLLKPIKPDQFLASLGKVKAKLESENQSSKERSKWVWIIKSFAEKLADQIWLLEEEKTTLMITELHTQIVENKVEPGLMKSLYADLIVYIKGELNKQSADFTLDEPLNNSILPNDTEKMRRTLIGFCQTLMDQIKEVRNFGHRKNILKAVAYIETHFREETLSLQEVADTVHMSPSYFSMEFKAETGISYKQFITKLRIDKAKELLNNPVFKTYEIAHSIGYGDYPHFTKTFKRHIGITPTQYRKRIGIS
ncbi:response regulator [Halobacillus rhizosphaerae]|uniref:response regulator transcription factor n=1 Tax=Halobacillus rhizosphaerae TaxID=3064889 RepID=UPI00398AFE94